MNTPTKPCDKEDKHGVAMRRIEILSATIGTLSALVDRITGEVGGAKVAEVNKIGRETPPLSLFLTQLPDEITVLNDRVSIITDSLKDALY